MNIKLLALDMDGTVMKSDHVTLSGRNRAAIEAAAKIGVTVVIATGRVRERIPAEVSAIPGVRYALTANGAVVNDLKTGEILYKNPIPRETVVRVLDALAPFEVFVDAYRDGLDYYDERQHGLTKTFPFPESRIKLMTIGRFAVKDLRKFLTRDDAEVEKFNLPYIPAELHAQVKKALLAVGDIALTSSIADNIEINSATSNKADGLHQLCRRLGLERENVMAMGDSSNDLDMLRYAGFSVAPANATDDAKVVSDAITSSNDEDGVAEAIEKYLL